MPSEDEMLKIITSLVRILDAYKGHQSLVSCQGQGMDGYSALANFVNVAEEAKSLLESKKQVIRQLHF